MFMSTCFSGGMGPKQFSDGLQVQHKETFEYCHLQYLHMVVNLSRFPHAQGATFKDFGTFEGDYAGFVPSGAWLRDMWLDMMERQLPDIQKYMSMLSLHVFGMDHSHKVCNRSSRFIEN